MASGSSSWTTTTKCLPTVLGRGEGCAHAKTASSGRVRTMRYVALLRGINVGGNNIIPMKALAKTFEKLGLASVRTYIASGNVLFETTEKDARKLEERIAAAVKKSHACAAKVVVRS